MKLRAHAVRELTLAGLYDESDAGGGLGGAVERLIAVHESEQHSDWGARRAAEVFNVLVRGEPLTPLTDDPAEWELITEFPRLWKSRRHVTAYSIDGGKTWYDTREKAHPTRESERKLPR